MAVIDYVVPIPIKECQMQDNKYITFKRDEFQRKMNALLLEVQADIVNDIKRSEVEDAVVIRRQDHFAPAALSTYASSIGMAAKVLRDSGMGTAAADLQRVADYFSDQADAAAEEAHKLPD